MSGVLFQRYSPRTGSESIGALRQVIPEDRIGVGRSNCRDAVVRTISLLILTSFSVALLLSAKLAQQPGQETPGGSIGHPPPLPGPPPLADPSSATKPVDPAPEPKASEPASKGYLGAYAPPGTPPTPYSTGPLPTESTGPGLNVIAPDGSSTKTVRAVPCSPFARETDGFTTCVGVPDQDPQKKRR